MDQAADRAGACDVKRWVTELYPIYPFVVIYVVSCVLLLVVRVL